MRVTACPAIIEEIKAARATRGGQSLILGICGSQGSGKSTLAKALRTELAENHGLATGVLSLADLYLSTQRRRSLAIEVHPLLRTRGVPGTHDTALRTAVLNNLLNARPGTVTSIPRFDKASDEPCVPAAWEPVLGSVDIVVFEGWCVGARPQDPAALQTP